MQKTIVILSEKPHATRIIAPHVSAQWPHHRIVALHTMYIGAYRFALPRGLRWHDYPCIFELDNVEPNTQWANWRPMLIESGQCQSIDLDPHEELRAADEIVYACDPDHTGMVAAYITLQGVLGADKAAPMRHAINLRSLNAEAIRLAVQNPEVYPNQQLLSYGLTKRYFETNFAANSLAIFGKTLQKAGIDQNKHFMSKYMLQTLFYVAKSKVPLSEGALINAMANKWTGTGRYKREGNAVAVGSAASQASIITNLIETGLLETTEDAKRPTLCVSELGQRFLSLVHPDCEDADLPFRLDAWCEAGLEASKPAIDRYLKTFFGKQKRYIDSQ